MADNIKIKVRNLSKSFGNHKVLDGIDLDVKKDSSLVILGGSGTGKSVLIKTMIGLLSPDKGSIMFDNQETINISQKNRLKILENCGFLFQGGALFDSLNVSENITFFAQKLYSLKKNEIKELASKKLKSVGLSDRILELYPAELSGGMQKRVSLARAICTDPKIIFFDEPTTGLDPIMANVINDLIIKIREELGATTIAITHDMNSVRKIAKEVVLIHNGKIQWSGTKDEMENTDNPYMVQFINGLSSGPFEI
jgi:phospholipid/cholesterol/gamma-HCH transport system ATP-binding protein